MPVQMSDIAAQCVADIAAGDVTLLEVAERHKVTASKVSAWCHAAGVRLIGGCRGTSLQRCVRERLQEGMSAIKVAQECGCTRAYVYYVKHSTWPESI